MAVGTAAVAFIQRVTLRRWYIRCGSRTTISAFWPARSCSISAIASCSGTGSSNRLRPQSRLNRAACIYGTAAAIDAGRVFIPWAAISGVAFSGKSGEFWLLVRSEFSLSGHVVLPSPRELERGGEFIVAVCRLAPQGHPLQRHFESPLVRFYYFGFFPTMLALGFAMAAFVLLVST